MRRSLFLAASLALLAGCAGEEREGGTATMVDAPAPQLAGTSWEVTAIRGSATQPGMGTRQASIAFSTDGKVGFTGGCNRMMGTYSLTPPDMIRIGDPAGPGFASTRMACPGGVMAQDEALAQALLAAARLEADGAGWRLLDASGAEVARLEPGTAT